MCEHEIVGDYHRGCQHFHGRYYTGERTDCNSEKCKTSQAHKHLPTQRCNCPAVVTDRHRVQNMIHAPHPDCQ
ncbi:hypothetical protein BKA93DRAFT_816010 [Sparassis latifolia]|uniref:Uncharacterized protein n=1 Tax=Sparassis crispa TaxID=139825 RepID=A0A401GYK0_9APHY|nr:hypothetical protein SCP_1004810 [Sparassis crispa]GBE87234.1 hypothetical protein SCP_1004810 [Sparassis crispa]